MKKIGLCLLLVISSAMAQPPGPPGPPGPPVSPPKTDKRSTPAAAPSPGGQANLSWPHVLGQLSGSPPGRFTISRETQAGGPIARMDFRGDASTIVTPGLKSGERALVVYEMNRKGEGYRALAVVGCPQGSNPEELIKKLPKLGR